MRNNQIKAVFQNFDAPATGPTNKSGGAEKLASLRALMKENNLDVWLVPHGDEYQNEYPPAHAERLAWLTGFTGSAGFCVVTMDEALVFVDGRYTLQVSEQIDEENFTPADLVNFPPHKWLAQWLSEKENPADTQIGFDPWLTTLDSIRKLQKITDNANARLTDCDNLIDQIWHDQPRPPLETVTLQPQEFAGQLAMEKIADLKTRLRDNNADCLLISDPASICWLFNIRGGDTPHTPLALGYCIVNADDFPILFMDKRKIPLSEEAYLTQLADLHPPSQLQSKLAEISSGKTIWYDPANTAFALTSVMESSGAKPLLETDPIIIKRAVKNPAEIDGSRAAHLRDGVAVTKFLYWLDQQQPGSIDEITATKQLETIRRQCAETFQSELLDISFDTISGAGANGAIVHYRVTEATNTTLENGSLYLVDSGGQYRDGTTDITRTIAIGSPPQDAIDDFTLVLKGHIAIATARFPQGTRGIDLDPLARIALWQNGRDYAHGTGHGVGSYLAVHEGPQSISRRGMAKLVPGMIISNEPGYYRNAHYGIRIENLVLVTEAEQIRNGNVPVMSFETLSHAPIDLRLVNPELLNQAEINWLNAYHANIRKLLTPHLNKAEAHWLVQATRAVNH